jgi:hypothetical protein
MLGRALSRSGPLLPCFLTEAVAAVECLAVAQASPSLLCSSSLTQPAHHGTTIKQHGSWQREAVAVGARAFHVSTPRLQSGSVVSFPLAQTGEGISECELMQWFVKVCVCVLAAWVATAGRLVLRLVSVPWTPSVGVRPAPMHAPLLLLDADAGVAAVC